MEYKMMKEFQLQGQVSNLGATTSHHKNVTARTKELQTYMFLHIFFSLVSHLCPISNSYIGHGTLQKFIASKLSKRCWKSRHFLSVFHTGVFKQWCGASWSPIVPPLVVSCRKKFKMLHLTSTFKPIFRKQEKQTK